MTQIIHKYTCMFLHEHLPFKNVKSRRISGWGGVSSGFFLVVVVFSVVLVSLVFFVLFRWGFFVWDFFM